MILIFSINYKKRIILISSFNKNEKRYSVIKIFIFEKLENTIVMHGSTMVDFNFMNIPLSVIIRNNDIFKIEPILIEMTF